MAADPAAYAAAVKETWTSDKLEEQLNQDAPTLAELEKTSRYEVGGFARTPLHVSRNGGFTAVAKNETVLNTAGQQGTAQATWEYTHQHMQIKIAGSAIDATSSNMLSVVNVVDAEVNGAVNDLKHQLERQLFAPPVQFAGIGTTASSATQTLDADGIQAIAAGFLFVGALIDIGTTGSTASLGTFTVTAIPAANQITLSSSVSTTAGTHFISWKGSGLGGTRRELNSLREIVASSGTLGNVDPAVQPSWKSYVDSSTTSLTNSAIFTLNTKVFQATSERPDLLVMSPLRYQNLYEQIQPQIQFSSDTQLATGSMKVQFMGQTIIADPNCPDTTLYALSKKRLFLVATDKPHWQNDVTGGKILDWIPNEDAFGGRITYRIQLATNARNAHAKITSLT
jgi:hypothetical protein